MLSATFLVAAALFGMALSGPMPPSSEESVGDFSELPKDELKKMHDACVKDLGLTPDDKKKSETQGKILACMFQKDGTMTEDGMFSADGTIANAVKMLKANPEKVAKIKEMATECGQTLSGVKAPKEEMAQKIAHCFRDFDGKSTRSSTGSPSTSSTHTVARRRTNNFNKGVLISISYLLVHFPS